MKRALNLSANRSENGSGSRAARRVTDHIDDLVAGFVRVHISGPGNAVFAALFLHGSANLQKNPTRRAHTQTNTQILNAAWEAQIPDTTALSHDLYQHH